MSWSTDAPSAPPQQATIWPLRSILVPLGVAYLAVDARGRLAYALPRLVRDIEEWSAWDLKYRHNEVIQWFSGSPVYGVVDGAVYPPASHAILWPLLGWLDFGAARVFWAVTTMLAAGVLALLLWRLTRRETTWQRLFVAGLAFAGYPLQHALFLGQIGVHTAALAAVGAFLVFNRERSWSLDALGGILLACSLVKPTLSLPLVLAALIAAGRARPALITGAAYLALSLVAAAAQPAGLFALLRDWLAVGSGRVPLLTGVPNVHLYLARSGATSALMPVSLSLLAVAALCIWKWRSADPWLLVGAAAIFTRFWAHSMRYDDAFLLLAVLALVRSAHVLDGTARKLSGWLLLAAWVTLLTPGWAFFDLAPPYVRAIDGLQATLWLGVMIFLGLAARQHAAAVRSAGPDTVAAP
ncbi:MAG TPA: glycosyltransferase 87 family protein [Longimicrobiales bacterium]|nr:glycosyltransferase 87 family protein [Longimicrobiales bacterium]